MQSTFWNREESQRYQFSTSTSTESPVTKSCKIISLSNPNDPANESLDQGLRDPTKLPEACQLLTVCTDQDVLDNTNNLLETLRQQQANTVFVSHPKAREPLATLIREVPSIQWIHCRSAGIDFVVSETLQTSFPGITTNAKGQFSSTLAEYTLMACSYFAKDLPRLRRQQQQKEWNKYSVQELRGATLGIVGYGDIGRACAKLAAAYGMTITALRRHPQPDPLIDECLSNTKENLNRIFATSDYILCAAPLTEETRGMIGKEQFDCAKEDAVFINVGRGPIVDENAMIDALRAGQIKGAALDVVAVEPLPKESPLWEMKNVLLSPHNMDQTATFMHEATDFFVQEQLPRFVRDLPLLNKVIPKAGF